jgi:hypothetical protein
LDFIKTYTIMHQKQSSQYVIGFSYEISAGRQYRQCFLSGKILSAGQRQQRKSDVMTSFGLAACSAVYYQVPDCRFLIDKHTNLLPFRGKSANTCMPKVHARNQNAASGLVSWKIWEEQSSIFQLHEFLRH